MESLTDLDLVTRKFYSLVEHNNAMDNKPYKKVNIRAVLVTEEDPQFNEVYGQIPDNAPVNKSDMVVPIFRASFLDFTSSPDQQVHEMIHSEIDDYIKSDRMMRKLDKHAEPEKVMGKPPQNKPRTTPVPVGSVAVSPDQEGIITYFDFEKLYETVKQ